MSFAGVVFDLDGVLVDSEEVWAHAEEQTVTGVGGAYTPELRAELHGRGHRDGARIVAKLLGRDDPDAIAETLLAHALAGFEPGVRPVEGAPEIADWARANGPVAVASNSVRIVVETALASARLGAFDAIVAGEDVERPKPAPDPYLEACRRLGVAPNDALAVEDSPAGVASAKAAGLFVVGLNAAGVDLSPADVVVTSLIEIRDIRHP
jgi:HAD superfamily hydrolase (TIGR01509 family)